MRKREDITKELLHDRYFVQGKKLKEIAQELQCSVPHLSKKMKDFGLEINRLEKYLNQDFDDLHVKELYGHDEHSHAIFVCECKCGKTINVKGYSLLSGNTRSCGCTSRKRGKHHPLYMGYEELHGRIWKSLIRGAQNRGFEFSITIEEAWNKFIEQNRKCALTGLPLEFSSRTNEQRQTTASLDRIDSSKGYIKDNVQWIHKRLNRMKGNMAQEDFIYWCKLVAGHR